MINKEARNIAESDIIGHDVLILLAGISNDPFGNLTTELIYDPTRKYAKKIALICKKNKINYLKNLKPLKKIGTINNHSNTIHLVENFIVRKTLKFNRLGYILFNNEIKALSRLYKYDNFPKILGWDSRTLTIYMTYCGKEINSKNIPDNYLEQYTIIKNVFLKEKLSNNDILERNMCVLGDKINIIDFGLCNDFEINKVISELYYKLEKIYGEKKRAMMIQYYQKQPQQQPQQQHQQQQPHHQQQHYQQHNIQMNHNQKNQYLN